MTTTTAPLCTCRSEQKADGSYCAVCTARMQVALAADKAATPETDKAGFEIQTCGRCGGSGSYSFNLMHGSTCYGCGGTGKTRTKRGAAAFAHYRELQERPVAEIAIGDFVWYDNMSRAGWRKITGIVERTHGYTVEGVTDWRNSWEIGSEKLGSIRYGIPSSGGVRSIRNEAHRLELLAAALAFQATLGISGKPLKRKAKA